MKRTAFAMILLTGAMMTVPGARAVGMGAAPAGITASAALSDVVSISSSDAWAVGDGGIASRWDGASWTSRHLGGLGSPDLNGVDATSSSNVWAVGGVIFQDAFRGFASHWDGAGWHRTPVPGYPGEMILEDVAVSSSTDAYAVGRWFAVTPGGRRGGAAIVHWDGSVWRRVPAPASVASLGGITYLGSDFYEAVGTAAGGGPMYVQVAPSGTLSVDGLPEPAGARCSARDPGSGGSSVVGMCRSSIGSKVSPYIVELRNPGHWRVIDVPGSIGLWAADGSAAVWAVGRSAATGQAAILRRGHGGTWFRVTAPEYPHGAALLNVSSRTFNDAWSVGWRRVGTSLRPLALRWDGVSWTAVPVPLA